MDGGPQEVREMVRLRGCHTYCTGPDKPTQRASVVTYRMKEHRVYADTPLLEFLLDHEWTRQDVQF